LCGNVIEVYFGLVKVFKLEDFGVAGDGDGGVEGGYDGFVVMVIGVSLDNIHIGGVFVVGDYEVDDTVLFVFLPSGFPVMFYGVDDCAGVFVDYLDDVFAVTI
jgi:hypothetical protein